MAAKNRPTSAPVPLRPATAAVLLTAAVWAVYAASVSGPFLFDDKTAVLDLVARHGADSLDQVIRFWREGPLSYRPLRFLSLAIDWRIGGGSAAPFHVTNILLHGFCAMLLLGLLRRLAVPAGLALAAALLFVVHPIQTEAVAYISGRKDLLCAFFYLAALHASLCGARASTRRGRLLGGGGFLLAGLLSFLSKEMALTLPAAALLVDAIDRGGRPRADSPAAGIRSFARSLCAPLRGRPWFYGLLAGAGAIGLVDKLILAPGTKAPIEGWAAPLLNLPLAVRTLSLHVRKLIWPWPQVADLRGMFPEAVADPATGIPPASGFGAFWNGGGLAATIVGLLALAGLIIAARRIRGGRGGAAAAGIAFFLISLLPVANLIRLNEPAAEHYLYLPAAGGALALAALGAALLDRLFAASPRAAAERRRMIVAGLVLAALGAASFVRTGVWRGERELWTSVIAVNPGCGRAHNNLGLALKESGDAAGARAAFIQALRFDPGAIRTAANLAETQRSGGDAADAERTLRTALANDPDQPLLLSLLGGLLLAEGRVEEARTALERVAEIPGGPAAAAGEWARDLGVARLRAGDAGGAVEVLGAAAEADPENASLWTNLGAAWLGLGRYERAAAVLARAVALPDAPGMAYRNMAVAELKLGRPGAALAMIDEARRRGAAVPDRLAAAAADSLAAAREER